MKLRSRVVFSTVFLLILTLRITSTYVSQHTVKSFETESEINTFQLEQSSMEPLTESLRNQNESSTKTLSVYNSELNRDISIDEFNQMDLENLKTFPGIGDVTALAIKKHIEESGPFSYYEQLIIIKGIGEKKLLKILGNLP